MENNLAKAPQTDISADARPDFGKILDSLHEEFSLNAELVTSLTFLSNGVKNMEELTEKELIRDKEPSCLVEYFWTEIFRIRTLNRQLGKVVIHLQKVIGG